MAVHDYIKSGDFATEKHVPVIEAADKVKAGEAFDVTKLHHKTLMKKQVNTQKQLHFKNCSLN